MSRAKILVMVIALLISVAAIVSVPFLQRAADQRHQEEGRKAGAALVHRFDCTYGLSLKELLSSGAYSTSLQAAASYDLAHHQHGAARVATLKIARAQELRAADLLRQYGQIQPLSPEPTPCPPLSSRKP